MKELPWAFAAIGGKLDDVQLRTAETVLGATLRSTVELDRSKAKAKAEAKTAAKAKVKMEKAKRVVDDRGPERQMAQHLRRGLDRPPAGDRRPVVQRPDKSVHFIHQRNV